MYGVSNVSFVFFFKQKTAYEMRISDWSSDVCSSDLLSKRLAELANCAAAHCREIEDAPLMPTVALSSGDLPDTTNQYRLLPSWLPEALVPLGGGDQRAAAPRPHCRDSRVRSPPVGALTHRAPPRIRAPHPADQ